MTANTYYAGMAVVTSLNWGFNFTVAVSYPSMAKYWGLAWTFAFYSFWCFIGFFLILL